MATPAAPALAIPTPYGPSYGASYDASYGACYDACYGAFYDASPPHHTPARAPPALQHPPHNLRHVIHSARTLIIRSDNYARAHMHFRPNDCLDDGSEYVAAYLVHARRDGEPPSCWDVRWASHRP
jgi:hypothetical protein